MNPVLLVAIGVGVASLIFGKENDARKNDSNGDGGNSHCKPSQAGSGHCGDGGVTPNIEEQNQDVEQSNSNGSPVLSVRACESGNDFCNQPSPTNSANCEAEGELTKKDD